MKASHPVPPATGASAAPERSGGPGEPPDRLSRVRAGAASLIGRALLATLGLKLVVATLGPAAPGWLRVIDSVGTTVVAVGLGYLLFRLLATLQRRLLWRVRRKLVWVSAVRRRGWRVPTALVFSGLPGRGRR